MGVWPANETRREGGNILEKSLGNLRKTKENGELRKTLEHW